jgi:hypothetical protein
MIAEIREIRERIDQDARRIYELSQALHQRARRNPAGSTTPAFIMYSNAWTRFAGMVAQGMRRTVTAERVIVPAMEEKPEPPVKPKLKEPKGKVYRSPLPVNDDLVELFGEELVNASQ